MRQENIIDKGEKQTIEAGTQMTKCWNYQKRMLMYELAEKIDKHGLKNGRFQ